MALVHADRVWETSTSVGTGTYALAGAVTGYQRFSVVGNGNTCYYAATDGTDWEVGIGFWSTGNNLDRSSILASSNGGSAVSWGAGTKQIFLTPPAGKYLGKDDLDTDTTLAANSDSKIATQKAVKGYIDSLATNLGGRYAVRVATTANITIATALNNGDTIDGVSLVTGDLVLVKSQSSASENGVYVVGASPARAVPFDTFNEHPGSLIAVQEGTVGADTLWLCTSNLGGTLNSSSITFTQLIVGGNMLGSNNLSELTNAATARSNIGLAADAIEFVIDGGGAVLTTGLKGFLVVPFACTITQWTLLGDVSGSLVVNVWKDTYANHPPTVADKITASAPPTISSAVKGQSSTLTGWTTSLSAGDVLAFNVDSVTSITSALLSLQVTK